MAESLDARSPPDVYASWWEDPLVIHPLGVPVDPCLSEGETELYLPGTWPPRAYNQLWAWPRWVSPGIYVVNEDLLRTAGFQPEQLRTGWTWDDVTQLVKTFNNRAGSGTAYALAGNDGQGRFFGELLLAGANRADAVAQWLDELRGLDAFPAKGKDMSDQVVPLFLGGRVAAAGGLSPALAAFLLEKGIGPAGEDPGDRPSVSGLPVPTTGDAKPPISAGYLYVFRKSAYEGDDHTQAAVYLALHLSRWHTERLANRFLAVPGDRLSAEN